MIRHPRSARCASKARIAMAGCLIAAALTGCSPGAEQQPHVLTVPAADVPARVDQAVRLTVSASTWLLAYDNAPVTARQAALGRALADLHDAHEQLTRPLSGVQEQDRATVVLALNDLAGRVRDLSECLARRSCDPSQQAEANAEAARRTGAAVARLRAHGTLSAEQVRQYAVTVRRKTVQGLREGTFGSVSVTDLERAGQSGFQGRR